MRPRPVASQLWLALLMMVVSLFFRAHAAEVFEDAESFSASTVVMACADTEEIDFESVPYYDFVDDYYEDRGFVASTSSAGLLVDDTVDAEGTACVDTRCGRTPIIDDYGSDLPQWVALEFAWPVSWSAFQLIDFGTGKDGESATVVAWLDGSPVEELTFSPGGDDVDGGVFVGLSFASPVDRVVLHAAEAGDGFGVDDLQYPARTCHDGDGDGVTPEQGDCDDEDDATFVGAEELCDGIDNDCDGAISDAELDTDLDVYLDCVDTDGDGWTTFDGDCMPWDEHVHPGAEELCDELDTDCDGELPEAELDGDFDRWADCVDTDGDGWTTFDGDCDPWDAAVYPGAPEVCDGIDNRCTGQLDSTEADRDGDGYLSCDGDCNDEDPTMFPGAEEYGNGYDANCDGEPWGGLIGCAHAHPPRAWLTLAAFLCLLLVRRFFTTPHREGSP